jgi:hypothetical protein
MRKMKIKAVTLVAAFFLPIFFLFGQVPPNPPTDLVIAASVPEYGRLDSNNVWVGTQSFWSINSVTHASRYAGADAGAQIQAAINDITQEAGVKYHVIADFNGPQTISTPLKIREGAVVHMRGSYTCTMTSVPISSIVRSGGSNVTVTTSSAHGLSQEDPVSIAGVSNVTFNDDQVGSGTTVLVSSVTSSTVFNYVANVTSPDATSSGGTVARPCIWIQNVAELHGQGGTASSPLGVPGLQISAGPGFNGDLILALNRNGINQWWHGGMIKNVRLEGNRANQTTYGVGLEVIKFGDASLVSNVLSTQNKKDAFRYVGAASTNGRSEILYATVNDAWGINCLLCAGQLHILDSHITDNLVGGVQFFTGNGGLMMLMNNVVCETSMDPLFRFVRGNVQLTINNLSAQGSLGANPGKTLFKYETITGGTGAQPDIVLTNFVGDGDYTYLYQDTEKAVTIPLGDVAQNGLKIPFWQKGISGGMNVSGPMSFTPQNWVLVNGANGDVNTASPVSGDASTSFARITGPTAAFSISGLSTAFGSVNGQLLHLFNSTAQTMTLINDDPSVASPWHRIQTNTGANLAVTGPGVVTLIRVYDPNRWVVVSHQP